MFIMISFTFLLGMNLILYCTYHDLLKWVKAQIGIFNNQIDFYKRQLQEQQEIFLNRRNMNHDIKNHLLCIYGTLEKENIAYARKYINDLLSEKLYFESFRCLESGNLVIDGLLNYKRNIMDRFSIRLSKHIEIPCDLEVNEVDMCIIVGNCLDNSIEAVKMIDNKYKREIYIEIVYRKGCILFKFSNHYKGECIKDTHGDFITTKNQKNNHGIGLNMVRKIVKKYNGIMKIKTKENIFVVQILLYQ